MNNSDQLLKTITELLKAAFNYQLATLGPYVISKKKEKTEINNEIFNEFSLKYISSNRLDFDGGIELHFLAMGDLGSGMLRLINDNSIIVNLYNLENTGGEYDLEEFEINSYNDSERININLKSSELGKENINQYLDLIKNHLNSQKIQLLQTFTALKNTKP